MYWTETESMKCMWDMSISTNMASAMAWFVPSYYTSILQISFEQNMLSITGNLQAETVHPGMINIYASFPCWKIPLYPNPKTCKI